MRFLLCSTKFIRTQSRIPFENLFIMLLSLEFLTKRWLLYLFASSLKLRSLRIFGNTGLLAFVTYATKSSPRSLLIDFVLFFKILLGRFNWHSFRGEVLRAILSSFKKMVSTFRNKKRRSQDFFLKVDLEKAYDNVDWDFLKGCSTKMGIPASLICVIMFCVRSPTYSILWNGAALSAVTPSKGLRQGNPLSPYLFIIIMEKLSHAILSKVESGN